MKKIPLNEVWVKANQLSYNNFTKEMFFKIKGHSVDYKDDNLFLTEIKPLRTNSQNRAFRLYWKLLAQELNNNGNSYTSKRGKTLKFTEHTIEQDWRERMQEMFNVTSTSDLTTRMINDIYDCMNLDYSTDYGVYVPFPDKTAIWNKIDAENFDN